MTDSALPIATLRECLRLDADTGRLYWRVRPRHHFTSSRGWAMFNGKYANKEAFEKPDTHGYRHSVITIDGVRRSIYGHAVVFALHHGRWPGLTVDHRNNDRADNRPMNLREATPAQQMQNRSTLPANSTGLKGIYPRPNGRYAAKLRANGTIIYLGEFDTPEQAHAAYRAAAVVHHGEFARS